MGIKRHHLLVLNSVQRIHENSERNAYLLLLDMSVNGPMVNIGLGDQSHAVVSNISRADDFPVVCSNMVLRCYCGGHDGML